MEPRAQLVFLCLILSQGAHSIEEYVTKLYEVFAPARFVSSLVSQDLALGFLVVNAALVTFGLWCWAVPVRSRWQAARGFTWFWTILAATLFAFIFFFERHFRAGPTGPPKILPALKASAVSSVQILPKGQLEIRADRTNGLWQFIDSAATNYPVRFYRSHKSP